MYPSVEVLYEGTMWVRRVTSEGDGGRDEWGGGMEWGVLGGGEFDTNGDEGDGWGAEILGQPIFSGGPV